MQEFLLHSFDFPKRNRNLLDSLGAFYIYIYISIHSFFFFFGCLSDIFSTLLFFGEKAKMATESHDAANEVTVEPIENKSNTEPLSYKHESLTEYATGFFDWDVMFYVLFMTLLGVTTGYAGGMTGPWFVLQEFSEDCSKYTSQKACEGVMNADCIWASDVCGWRVGTCSARTKEDCQSSGYEVCHFDYSSDTCTNTIGYSSLFKGIFTSSPTVMQIVLGLFVGDILAFLHHRRIFMLSGFLLVFGSVMQHIGVATNEFWVSAMGRFCLGLGYVLCTVSGLVYVNQNAPLRYKQVLVSFYAPALNFGQFIPAAIGGAFGLTVDFASDSRPMYLHFELNLMFCTLLNIGFLLMGFFLEESPYWAKEQSESDTGAANEHNLEDIAENINLEEVDERELLQRVDDIEKAKGINIGAYSWWSMAGRLLVGVAVAAVVQLTGISAFSNYAPTITSNVGLNSLVGTMLIQAWNTFSASMCLVILGFTNNLRLVMLAGTAIAGVACIVLGVLVLPGVIHDTEVRNGISIAAIAVYILSFQSCIAAAFYSLAQEMFPLSFRPRGSSFVTMMVMLFSFLISVFFPIALEGLSGGASGNQNKGMGIIMIFFGVVAAIGYVVMFLFLQPWTAADEKQALEQVKQGTENGPDEN